MKLASNLVAWLRWNSPKQRRRRRLLAADAQMTARAAARLVEYLVRREAAE